MTRASLFILCLVAATLACNVQLEPSGSPTTSTPTATIEQTATRLIQSTSTATRQAVVTATRSLNVRESAGNNQRVIGVLFSGETVELTGECAKGWAQIVWKNGVAYVNAKYLSDNKCKE